MSEEKNYDFELESLIMKGRHTQSDIQKIAKMVVNGVLEQQEFEKKFNKKYSEEKLKKKVETANLLWGEQK